MDNPMMSLPQHEMHDLRDMFVKEDGLDIEQFVETMLDKLSKVAGAVGVFDEVSMVSRLIDTFKEIDINGDGDMDWDELTSYCVEAGMAATKHAPPHMTHNYVQTNYNDTTSRGKFIPAMRFAPSPIDRLFVMEDNSAAVKVYNRDLELVATIDHAVRAQKAPPQHEQHQMQRVEPSPSTEKVDLATLDVVFCSKKDSPVLCASNNGLVITTSTDQTLSFWSIELLTDFRTSFRFSGKSEAKSVQTCIMYCGTNDLLLSTGGHEVSAKAAALASEKGGAVQAVPGIITAWNLSKFMVAGKESFRASVAFRMERHTDSVTDIISIPAHKLFASASMDRKINLWASEDGSFRGDMVRRDRNHKILAEVRGVKKITYTADHDLLLSIGFEFDVFAWDISSCSMVLKLEGHRCSLVGIQLIQEGTPSKSRAVTVDQKGNMKLWDIQRNMIGTGICLQNFAPSTSKGAYQPYCFAALPPSPDLVVGGPKMRGFEFRKVRKASDVPAAALYNSQSMTFAVALNNGVKVFCALSGRIREHFHGVSETEITSLCFDNRKRKLIVGNHGGEIIVLHYRNGQQMKRFETHGGNVTTLCYSNPDQVLISTSWDRTIRFHDEKSAGEGSNEMCPMMREITHVHRADVTCMAFSFGLSLVATGSADFSVRFWDFQFARLEERGVCRGHTAEVTALVFVDPYPVLVSADCKGDICVWGVRPLSDRYSKKPLHRMRNMTLRSEGELYLSRDDIAAMAAEKDKAETAMFADAAGGGGSKAFITAVDDSSEERKSTGGAASQGVAPSFAQRRSKNVPVPITAARLAYLHGDTTEPHLVTGDDWGDIKVWRLWGLLSALGIRAIHADDMPSQAANYNPERRVRRSYLSLKEAGDNDDGDAEAESAECKEGKEDTEASSKRSAPKFRRIPNRASRMPVVSASSRGGTSGGGGSDRRAVPNQVRVGGADNGGGGLFPPISAASTASSVPFGLLQPSKAAAPLSKIPDAVVVHKWRAHSKPIKTIEVVEDPLSVLSTSFDMSVRVWGLDGTPLGVLIHSEQERDDIGRGIVRSLPWQFRVDEEARKKIDESEASELLHKIKENQQEEDEKNNRHASIQVERAQYLERKRSLSPNLMLSPSSSIASLASFPPSPAELNAKNAGGFVPAVLTQSKDLSVAMSMLAQLNPEDESEESESSQSDASPNLDLDSLEEITSEYKPPEKERVSIHPPLKYTNFTIEEVRHSFDQRKDVDITATEFLKTKLGLVDGCLPKRKGILDQVRDSPPSRGGHFLGDVRQQSMGMIRARTDALMHRKLLGGERSAVTSADSSPRGLLDADSFEESLASLKTYNQRERGSQFIARIESIMTPPVSRGSVQQDHASQANAMGRAHASMQRFESLMEKEDKAVAQISLEKAAATPARQARPPRVPLLQRAATHSKPLSVPRRSMRQEQSAPDIARGAKDGRSSEENKDVSGWTKKKSTGAPQMFGSVAAKDVVEVQRMFAKMDQDGSGTVSIREFAESDWISKSHMFENAHTIFDMMDKDMSGEIDMKEILGVAFPFASAKEVKRMLAYLEKPHLPNKIAEAKLTEEQSAELRELFHLFDTDGSGELSLGELFDALVGNIGKGEGDSQAAMSIEELRARCGADSFGVDEFIDLLRNVDSGANKGRANDPAS